MAEKMFPMKYHGGWKEGLKNDGITIQFGPHNPGSLPIPENLQANLLEVYLRGKDPREKGWERLEGPQV